jgi:ABC-type polar amino acid transport system ATPase subunit
VIRIRGLRKRFGVADVLRGVDAEVAPGAIVAIVGPSGCGKSTLLRCMNALESFDEGSVEVAGVSLAAHAASRATLHELRASVGMVFQEFHLFPHMSVLANVTLAPRVVLGQSEADARKHALELLARVGLADRGAAHPAELSGGQKQRVAIARALALPLKVLLLDEPTSALDPDMREEVREVLRGVAERHELTIVLVTHEMRLATELANDLWVMDAGRIVERGAPKEILASPKSDVARDFFARGAH